MGANAYEDLQEQYNGLDEQNDRLITANEELQEKVDGLESLVESYREAFAIISRSIPGDI